MTNPLTNNTQETIVELPQEKKEFAIGSDKYTLSELVTALGLDGLTDQEKYENISMHIRKGSVLALNKQTKQEKILINVTKGLQQISHIRKLHAEQQQSVAARRAQTNADRLKYEDTRFSVAERVIMEDVRTYLQNKGIPASVVQDIDTHEYIFTIAEATDAELNALDKYMKGKEFAVKAKSASAKTMLVTSTALKVTLAATGAVLSGTMKVAVDVTGKTAEALTSVGAATIVRGRDIYHEAARNLSNSKEAMEAKEMISSGWDMLKTKFGGKKGSRFF